MLLTDVGGGDQMNSPGTLSDNSSKPITRYRAHTAGTGNDKTDNTTQQMIAAAREIGQKQQRDISRLIVPAITARSKSLHL